MTICIPIFQFGKAGGYRVLSNFANHFINYGHKVTFITFCDTIPPYFETSANIILISFWGKKVNQYKKIIKFPFDYFIKRVVLKYAIQNFAKEYDIVLATQSLTAFSVFKSKVNAKKFYYIQAYEPEMYKIKGLLYKPYELVSKKSYSYNLIKIVNAELYLNYKEICTDKFVWPGINLDIFYPKSNRYIDKDNIIILGCVGRVEVYKGTSLVLKAFNKIVKKGYKVELHIAYGQELDNYEKGIKILNLNNDFELSNFYRSVDIIIAPGTIQLGAIHYPVLESMACNTPVITTNYSRSNDKNAFLIKINDVDSIIEAFEYIIYNRNEVRYRSLNALENVKDFEWDISASKMIKYFNSSN